ncbi:MAG: NUDIX domain-containing protein [Lachnospiraceae bacterium]|nr:NUDIX domain-containing protein [Lachnospiraceae bacterium]
MRRSTLCYIEKEGKLLLLFRNKKENDPNEGKWIGIGGGIEDGETPEECVVREVREETGLTLTAYHYHGIVKFVSESWEDEEMHLFSASGFEGELASCCDEGELSWIDKDKVMSLPMWEGDRYFLGALLQGKERINMQLVYEGKGPDEHLKEVIEENE